MVLIFGTLFLNELANMGTVPGVMVFTIIFLVRKKNWKYIECARRNRVIQKKKEKKGTHIQKHTCTK